MKGYSHEYRELSQLGAPVLVTQLGVIIVSFADTMMIGSYGTNELAACAFVNSVFTVPVVMLIGFAGGVTPLIGALFTQKRWFDAGRTLRASVQMNLLMGVLMTLAMWALWHFVGDMGQPEELLPLIRRYYLILLASIIPMSLFNCCQQMANGVTDTALPMWIMLGTNVINILGNYALIFGHWGAPEMGLAGAGFSTLAARTAGTLAIVLVIGFHRRYARYRGGLTTGGALGDLRRQVWTTSYPVMIQGGIECFLWTFGTVVCGWFGKIQLAAYQVVTTLSQIGFMTYMSMATAVAIRVANKRGLNDVAGMRRTATAGLHLNLVLATIASLVFVLGGRTIIHMFTPDEAVIASAMTLMLPMVLYQYGDAMQYVYSNAQRGTQYVKPLAVVSVVCYLVVGVVALYLLGVVANMGNVGVYYSFSIALFSAAVMFYFWFGHTLRRRF